jgi:hypothetical protein
MSKGPLGYFFKAVKEGFTQEQKTENDRVDRLVTLTWTEKPGFPATTEKFDNLGEYKYDQEDRMKKILMSLTVQQGPDKGKIAFDAMSAHNFYLKFEVFQERLNKTEEEYGRWALQIDQENLQKLGAQGVNRAFYWRIQRELVGLKLGLKKAKDIVKRKSENSQYNYKLEHRKDYWMDEFPKGAKLVDSPLTTREQHAWDNACMRDENNCKKWVRYKNYVGEFFPHIPELHYPNVDGAIRGYSSLFKPKNNQAELEKLLFPHKK